MAGTKARRAAVPCSTGEEEGCFEQERFGTRGKIPFLETCNILSREESMCPSFSAEKCRETICSAPLLLSGLCRTPFSTVSRKDRSEKAPIFEAGFSKLHPQVADMLHPVCRSRSYVTFAQCAVATEKFNPGKPGIWVFFKCIQQ